MSHHFAKSSSRCSSVWCFFIDVLSSYKSTDQLFRFRLQLHVVLIRLKTIQGQRVKCLVARKRRDVQLESLGVEERA